jgi:hypothetical protein
VTPAQALIKFKMKNLIKDTGNFAGKQVTRRPVKLVIHYRTGSFSVRDNNGKWHHGLEVIPRRLFFLLPWKRRSEIFYREGRWHRQLIERPPEVPALNQLHH